MKKLLIICALVGFSSGLSGCNTSARLTCPGLKDYSAAEQKALAVQFAHLPREARRAINDYGQLRAECRAL